MLVNKVNFLRSLLPWLLILLLAIIASLRGATTDTQGYYDLFYAIDSISLNPYEFYSDYGIEWFFGLLTVILKGLGLGHYYLFFIFSLATFYFFYKTSKIINNNLTEVLFYYIGAYYIYQQLAFIRFGLATTFIYYIIYLSTREKNSFIVLLSGTFCASLIHTSSILVILIYMVIKYLFLPRKISIIKKILFFLIILIGINLFKNYLIWFLSLNSEKVEFYSNSDIWGVYSNLFSIENIKALILFFVFALFYLMRKKIKQKDAFTLLLALFTASVTIRFTFYDFGIISSRIGYALGFSEVFIIPLIVKEVTGNIFVRFLVAIAYLIIYRLFAQTSTFDVLINDYLTPLI